MGCNSCAKGWLTTAAHGAVGLAKVAAGVDKSSDDIAAERLAVCKGCEHLTRAVKGLPESADVGLMDRCNECGCFVRAKVLIGSEQCPLGKW